MMILVVKHQFGPGKKQFAEGTFEIALVAVDPHVLVQVTLLGEGLATAEDWTNEGFLLGMASEVVEKIVPFFETSLAPAELT